MNEVLVQQKEHGNGKKGLDKKHCCLFCEKIMAKMPRHLKKKHANEIPVARVLAYPKKKDQVLGLSSLMYEGDYQHNYDCLQSGIGMIIPRYCGRKGKRLLKAKDLVPCEYCKALFVSEELYRHKCSMKSLKDASLKKSPGVKAARLMLPLPSYHQNHAELYKTVIVNMKDDDMKLVVESDSLIKEFGSRQLENTDSEVSNVQNISTKLRELGRLLIEVKGIDTAITSLKESLLPKNWQLLLNAVKNVAGYDSSTRKYKIPSLALKLGYSLKHCAKIARCQSIIERDRSSTNSYSDFLELYDAEYYTRISARARNTLYIDRYNRPLLLPLAEDVTKMHKHLQKELDQLMELPCPGYQDFVEALLAQVILFNRKRAGEAQRMKIEDYQNAVKNAKKAPDQTVLKCLTKFEAHLCASHLRVEIRGKKGRKVPVLLTERMQKGIELLLKFRERPDVNPTAKYVFARPGNAKTPYFGNVAIRKHAILCHTKQPELLTSTGLRKQLGTICQILALSETHQDILAGFMGHDIRVHRQFYRLPENFLEVAKVSKVLHAINEGRIAEFQGKDLEEINVGDNETVEFEEDDDDDAEDMEEEKVEDQQPLNKAHSSTKLGPCGDQETNCEHLNDTLQVCKDIKNAQNLCRKYCRLCNHVDGSWNVWSVWSRCSLSCGTGTASGMRICNNPAPANGGLQCTGNNMEAKSCNVRECPVHGGWAPWQEWGSCSSQCGLGLMKRRRTCTSPSPTYDGNYCFGDNTETELCNGTSCFKATPSPPPTPSGTCNDAINSCDVLNSTLAICAEREKARTVCKHYCKLCGVVDGHWTHWSDWKRCSVTCGNGTTSRARSCANPSPANGGHSCTGQTLESKDCNKRECPVHGGWAMWGSWTTCTATCGTGLTHRRRDCNNPSPSLFGSYCYGDPTEYNLCVVMPCPVSGKWNSWTPWSLCNTTCGRGTVSRLRECNNPEPSHGGSACVGYRNETKSCYLRNCPVGQYGPHGTAVVSCGTGFRKRRRSCNNPIPAFGGYPCFGDSSEYGACHNRTCSINGNWSGWTSWGSCSVTCGTGLRTRGRSCNNLTLTSGRNFCFGDSSENELCQNRTCPSKSISFTVTSPSSGTYTSGHAIIFTRAVNNDGGGYSSATGMFTASVAGQYLFSLNVVGATSTRAIVRLVKNYFVIGQVMPDGDFTDYDTASVTAAVNLQKGDIVWAMYVSGTIDKTGYTSFTGVLIHP